MRAVMDSAEPRWEQMRAAGYFEAVAAKNHETAAEIYREANPELFQSKGEAIVRAGRRARMSADAAGEVPDPEKGSVAAGIILAGKRRRGEIK
jgi:hypothetical protein